jgi:hypothetical protein
MKLKVIISSAKLSDNELSAFALNVVTKMTGNANFTELAAKVTKLSTDLAAFNKAEVDAMGHDHTLVVIKNAKRKALLKTLSALALSVEIVSDGDETIALGSGFLTKREGEPQGVLSAPTNLTVKNGDISGTMDVSVDPVKGAQVYFYHWTQIPYTADTVWKTDVSKTSITIPDLTPGKEYAVKVCAIGADPGRVYTPIVTRFAS